MSAQAPLKVSPLIKIMFHLKCLNESFNADPVEPFPPWSFLIAGFTYGSMRYNYLMKRERKRLDDLERTRPEREAREAAEKERKAKEEMEELDKLMTS